MDLTSLINLKQAARYIASLDFQCDEQELYCLSKAGQGPRYYSHADAFYYDIIDLEAWAWTRYQTHDNVVVFPVTNCRIDWFKPVESVELALAA